MAIQVGDVVRLKTGTTKMTVIRIQGDMAVCHYIDENDWNKEKEAEYPLAALIKADS